MDEYRRANRDLWNEYTRINAASQMYDLAGFKAGRNALHPLEIEELGDVQGKSLLHLQCHFGMDTLTWARLGAQVTGVDFSPDAVTLARSLADELGLPARFIHSDVYDLPNHLDETFDIVFTSYGALTWLSDIPGWARVAARYVRPGGTFYIAEFHPAACMFSDESERLEVNEDYFNSEMLTFPVQGSYADRTAVTQAKTSYEWNYPLGTVVSSLIEAGLRLEFLHEFDYTVEQGYKFLVKGTDGLWRMPAGMPRIPLLFSIRARKE